MVRRTRVMFHIGTQMHNHEPDAEVPVDFSAITDRIYKDAGCSFPVFLFSCHVIR
jgi:hypothetical protein